MAATEKPAALVDHDNAEALLKRLEWTVLRRLDGVLQGDHRTLMRGAGLDLADLREYQHHDDVRYIDWNVTARLQTPYVRQFTEDRELSAWFLVDLSASVDFGSNRFTKRKVAREFVAVLSRLLTRRGNRVGALLYGNNVDTVLPARGGRIHVLNLLQRMATQVEPEEACRTDNKGNPADDAEYLGHARDRVGRRPAQEVVIRRRDACRSEAKQEAVEGQVMESSARIGERVVLVVAAVAVTTVEVGKTKRVARRFTDGGA